MSWTTRRLDVPPEPLRLASALARRPGVVVLWVDEGRTAFVGSDPIALSTALDPEPELALTPSRAEGSVPRWVGLVPYEACRRLEPDVDSDPRAPALVQEPLWLRYAALARITDRVEIVGEDARAVRALARRLLTPPEGAPVRARLRSPLEPESEHVRRIERALDEISRGTIYEVNLARRLTLEVDAPPWSLLGELAGDTMPPHAFALRFEDLDVCAASPELCLRLDPPGKLTTSPIKGTRPRRSNAEADAALARELDEDPKERAELTMIIDVERNDLGRVAVTGSVRLTRPPHVVSLSSVHHRLATIEAELRPGFTRSRLLTEFLPSGSVTGAPKRRAMQLIRELEPHRRGLYTGVVGCVRHDGGLELSMAIRTLVARNGVGHYFTGGGIVADSVPAREVEETVWKAERILALAGARPRGESVENFPE
ncbi:MAG TPA: anthranilate synthase component I family protein [Polyangiaceae bacterium]|nr:anthranilate synthase component I family protein [Polyangiaceae bacterium]